MYVSPKTLGHLEWARILDRLAEHCRSPVAAEQARALDFAADRAALDDRLVKTSEARRLIDQGHHIPLGGLVDIDRAVGLAARGALLEPEDLVAVGKVIETAARCRRYFADLRGAAPTLTAIADDLLDAPDLGRTLLDTFDEHGDVADSASGELGFLRTRVAGLHEQLKQTVHGMLSAPEYEGMLQDEYYTIREDRYVLPIRSGHKNHIDGIVHGWSGSGATVYIEPQAVVDANNKLMMAQAEVDREIRRILIKLSRQVGDKSAALRAAQRSLAVIDLSWAAGLLSKELDCTRPTMVDDGRLLLKSARHPLLMLGGVEVVPNDLALDREQQVLVVTGPNTGGKTVSLKTAGLAVLMAGAGLHVPAADGSLVPRVPGVHSDIGDEQSLDESRSTFSGHLANIVDIWRDLEPGALVLLDELAVGTDPIQGAALAQAILEAFADKDSLVLVTTHYESLKALPFEDQRFRNGAMGFDEASGTPTYHLTFDIPGASSGLRTARRLGLDSAIVDRAAALAGPQQQALESVIVRLEREANAARAAREEAEKEQLRLINARTAAEGLQKKLEQRLKEGIAKERDKALAEARTLRDELRRMKKAARDAARKADPKWLQKQQSQVEEKIAAVVAQKQAEAQRAAGPAPDPGDLKPGQTVWVISLNNEAQLLEGPDDKGRCQVRAGIITATVDVEDLRPRAFGKDPANRRGGASGRTPARKTQRKPEPKARPADPEAAAAELEDAWEAAPPQAPDNTVDVRGLRAHEAVDKVERFLDSLVEREQPIAFVIHGHGTGALKREIRQWLKTSRYAREHRRGGRYEGGDGVTAVLLA